MLTIGKKFHQPKRLPYFNLLKYEFLVDDAAPIADPLTNELGTLEINDSANNWSIVNGKLVPSAATFNNNNPGIWVNAGYSRVTGRALKVRVKRVSAYGTGANRLFSPAVMWTTVAGTSAVAQMEGVGFAPAQMSIVEYSGTSPQMLSDAYSDQFYEIALVLRSAGMFMIVNNCLELVTYGGNAATVYPDALSFHETNGRHPPEIDAFRVTDLGGEWANDYGIVTQRLPGARAQNDTFVHEQEFLLDFVVTTLPSSNFIIVRFRYQDPSNNWFVRIGSTGTIELFSVIGGTAVSRTSMINLQNGDRVTVGTDGMRIRLYVSRAGVTFNGATFLMASTVATFKEYGSGIIGSLGTGGAISDLNTWPRHLQGHALALLEAVGEPSDRIHLKDEFTTDVASPLPETRACEPGPGTLTVTDVTSAFSISGGQVIPSGTGSTAGSPGLHDNSRYPRTPGLALKARVQSVSAFGGGGAPQVSPAVCWSNGNPSDLSSSNMCGISFNGTGQFYLNNGSSASSLQGIDNSDVDVWFDASVIQMLDGHISVINDKIADVAHTNLVQINTPIVSTFSSNRRPPRIEYFRVHRLHGPWQDRDGLSTDRIRGVVPYGRSFIHTSNCILQFTVGALPSLGSIRVHFRKQDASNYWEIEVQSGGTFALHEVVAGSPTQRASTTVQAGDRAILWMDGSVTRLGRRRPAADAKSSIYSSVSSFATQTSGEINSLGTGGSILDFVAYPRDLPPLAKSILDAV